jgi:hypothetical protein
MVPDGKENLVLQRLVENVKQRDRHLSTGFVGTNPLFQELTERGRSELVWDMAMQEDSPGLWFMLKDGGTTIWETWFERGGRSSHNMINIGGPWGEWFIQALGGIRPDPDEPGFKKSIIKPEVVGNLDWVEASYESVHGEISSAWRIGDGRLTLSVGIPANTTATVHMPVQEGGVREGGYALPEATGVERLRGNEERTVLRVGSGTYEFSTPWTDEDEGT